VAEQTFVSLVSLVRPLASNMPYGHAATRTRCVVVLAVITLHILLLAYLHGLQSTDRVQPPAPEQLLTVILAPAKNPDSLPPISPRRSQHAQHLSQPSSRLPAAHRRIRPTDETVHRRIDMEEAVSEAPETDAANSAGTGERAASSNNADLSVQPPSSTSNTGALDQRWLPRHADSAPSGVARSNLEGRANEDKVERAMSRSARADCRNRYAHMGLLGIPFLLNDTASDTGCKWLATCLASD